MNSYYSRYISKDTVNKKLTGVCAGIADFYGKSRLLVRVLTLCSFFIFPGITIGAYIAASVLLPKR
jgi:phage shock protein PspC (stress-responsive transcriptional regulator)